MSTISTSGPTRQIPGEEDPFRYGWRYVIVRGPDGKEKFDQVPLSREDVLFPQEGDVILQTALHDTDRGYLKSAFKMPLSIVPDAVVLCDCGVDWNLPGVRPICPDISIFFGVKRRYENWLILNVAAEGALTKLVIEVTSPSTRENDLEEKLDIYERAHVPLYVIADATNHNGRRRLELIAYRDTPDGYERVERDALGRIWLEVVGLWLGVVREPQGDHDRLACFDPETGEEVGDYTAVRRELKESREARAEAEALRARAGAEARAEAEARRAEAEARAREQAEARIRELEEILRRPGRNGPAAPGSNPAS